MWIEFLQYIYEVISIKLKKVFTRIILTKLYMGSQRTFSAFFCLKFFFNPIWSSEHLFYKPLKLALFINTVSTYHFSKNFCTIMNISRKLISLGKYPSRVFLPRKFKEYYHNSIPHVQTGFITVFYGMTLLSSLNKETYHLMINILHQNKPYFSKCLKFSSKYLRVYRIWLTLFIRISTLFL